MNLNDLLLAQNIDPKQVLVFRHRPHEAELNKVLPWLAAEKPEVFNAYQQTQGQRLESVMESMQGNGYVASFIGREPGKALFVGLYSIDGSQVVNYKQLWEIPEFSELRTLGMNEISAKKGRMKVQWFDLTPIEFYTQWKGRLSIGWPTPERSWWRRAHRNVMPILSIVEDSVLDSAMPQWDAIDFTWEELRLMPSKWKTTISQWRGIYYIFDTFDAKGYVGSAYGKENILGRWENYAKRGDGGNLRLRKRDPQSFRFTILQRVSPDMESTDVIRLESSWKNRLHTREFGLNAN